MQTCEKVQTTDQEEMDEFERLTPMAKRKVIETMKGAAWDQMDLLSNMQPYICEKIQLIFPEWKKCSEKKLHELRTLLTIPDGLQKIVKKVTSFRAVVAKVKASQKRNINLLEGMRFWLDKTKQVTKKEKKNLLSVAAGMFPTMKEYITIIETVSGTIESFLEEVAKVQHDTVSRLYAIDYELSRRSEIQSREAERSLALDEQRRKDRQRSYTQSFPVVHSTPRSVPTDAERAERAQRTQEQEAENLRTNAEQQACLRKLRKTVQGSEQERALKEELVQLERMMNNL